jgi:NAD(P)-dependent dehydrogenase (short-subunit alcohol dehydrogenase family)
MGRLEGKIAVVTGGASGIGLAVSERFARDGAQLVLVDRRADRFDDALARVGPGARGVEVDVSDDDQLRALFEDLPRVDILCTFAGGAVFGAIDELPPSKWRDLFAARFFGQLSACHYAVPKMPEGGVIMLCSGVADRTHVTEYAGGTALCGAVNALGRALAVELGPRGIRVNVLSPGFIVGTQIDFNLEGERVIDLVKGWIGSIPLGRPGSPEDMAEAAYFFATCEYASGQTIEVDGAWTAT